MERIVTQRCSGHHPRTAFAIANRGTMHGAKHASKTTFSVVTREQSSIARRLRRMYIVYFYPLSFGCGAAGRGPFAARLGGQRARFGLVAPWSGTCCAGRDV